MNKKIKKALVLNDTLIRAVQPNEVKQLRDISELTFVEAFGSQNDPEDMNDYIAKAFSMNNIQEEFDDPNSEFFFVDYQGDIIAYLKLNIEIAQKEQILAQALEIERIYVLPEFYGQKVGYKLMRFSIERAKQKGLEWIWLGVWEQNHAAIKFYKSFKFKPFSKHSFKLGKDIQTDVLLRLKLHR